jgi:hypothetical protein
MDETWRCRQCGWVSEAPLRELPRHGARVRCDRCGTLLPPVTRQPEAPAPPPPAPPAGAAPVPEEPRPTPAAAPEPDSEEPPAADDSVEGEAARRVRGLLAELARRERGALTEAILWSEQGERLAELVARWQTDHPGDEALAILRTALLAAVPPARQPLLDAGDPRQPGSA